MNAFVPDGHARRADLFAATAARHQTHCGTRASRPGASRPSGAPIPAPRLPPDSNARDGDEVPGAVDALRRPGSGVGSWGSKGGAASPCQTAVFNTAWAGSPALAASNKPVADVSESRLRPPPMRWRSTPANAPGNPFTGPREARPAAGRRPAMPGRSCTREPDRRLIPASAPVDGHGHQVRLMVDQPELRVSSRVSPRLVVLPFTLR